MRNLFEYVNSIGLFGMGGLIATFVGWIVKDPSSFFIKIKESDLKYKEFLIEIMSNEKISSCTREILRNEFERAEIVRLIGVSLSVIERRIFMKLLKKFESELNWKIIGRGKRFVRLNYESNGLVLNFPKKDKVFYIVMIIFSWISMFIGLGFLLMSVDGFFGR